MHKCLTAGVVVSHKFGTTEQGVLQVGTLSSLQSNIILNELDEELKNRGRRFVPYADDLVIFCKSKRAGERIKSSIIEFIEKRLFFSKQVKDIGCLL